MTNSLRIGVAQYEIKPGKKEDNITKAASLVRRALASEADLVVLPEYFSVGFLDFSDYFTADVLKKLAEPIPGPTTNEMGKLLKGQDAYVVLGSQVESSDGRLYNTSVVLGPNGAIVGKYRKVHLWTLPPRDEEKRGISPGSDYPVFDLKKCKLGVQVGVDIDNPEPWRVLALKGAEAIAWPGVCPVNWLDVWRFLGQARGFEDYIYIATTNRIGGPFFGKSRIISPMGEVLATMEGEEGVLVQEVDLDIIKKLRANPGSPLIRRYPATYTEITKPA